MSKDDLNKAKGNKQDEFYTQYEDIQKELNYYEKHFKGKIVLCNADDPFESNFCKFFLRNFNYLGLKRLICTSYNSSPVAGTQISMFDMVEGNVQQGHGYVLDVTSVPMKNGRGVSDEDIDKLLKSKKAVRELEGNGDFRSDECIEYLKLSDVVVTNPPFSLFKEFMSLLVKYNKQFLIIGNMNATHYKEVFPLIMENKMWWGVTTNGSNRYFRVPDYYPLKEKTGKIIDGVKYAFVKGVMWYTNLDHKHRHDELVLYKTYNEEEYPKYDNYDAIEIGKFTKSGAWEGDVNIIPKDYNGIMGVPDTFLNKYNPDQFEILGCTQRGCHERVPDTKKYNDYIEISYKTGKPTGSSGSKTNENGNLSMNDGKKNYFINKDGHIVQSTYSRLFIRRKEK